MRRFENRVAVVTGAASGIGRATAMALSREGCHLALVDIKAEPLEETRTLCRADRHVSTHVVNVADKAAMQQLASDVAREHGGTHVLVNNAGVAVGASFMEQSLEDFRGLEIDLGRLQGEHQHLDMRIGTIGVVVVSNDAHHADTMLRTILEFFERDVLDAEMHEIETEVFIW